MSLSRTLLIGSLVVAAASVVLTAIIVSTAGYLVTKDEIEKQTQHHLVALREEQSEYISSYLKQIQKQVVTYSASYSIQTASKDFRNAFNYEERRELSENIEKNLSAFYHDDFKNYYKSRNPDLDFSVDKIYKALNDQAKIYQNDFIAQNVYPIGKKDKLVALSSNSIYSKVHQKYHPEIRKYLQTFDYYDIFIIDANTGNIIYSVFKELDFATSLLDGPYRNSELAKVFKQARNSTNPDSVSFSAFKPYLPSYKDPAAFIASPIVDTEGNTIAVLAFQMPIIQINKVLTMNQEWRKKGLGESGETYLVSDDFKSQSLNRLLIENPEAFITALSDSDKSQSHIDTIKVKKTNIGYQEIKTASVEKALNGESGYLDTKNYFGLEVLSAYSPLEFAGAQFALIAEIAKSEAYSFQGRIIRSTVMNAFIISLVIVCIVAFIAWRFSRNFATRLNQAVEIANGVARGEKLTIEEDQKNDEISALMLALNKMQAEVIGKFELAAEESNRITSAVEAASTNIMMTNREHNIIYMNPACHKMMFSVETNLKQDLPHFDAHQLVGQNIDVFYKSSSHQPVMLENLKDTYKTTIKIDNCNFSLIITPVFDEEQVRLGTVIEWVDKTKEVQIEEEVKQLILAANAGDLSKRLNTEGHFGFVESLSTGLNTLLDQISSFVNDIARVFEAMSEGDLTKKINKPYNGELEAIKLNVNDSIAKLTAVLSNIQSTSDIVHASSKEVAQGSDDLSRRTESQASSLEETAASMEEITATVKETTENATQSNKLASEAKAKAEQGGEVVQGAVKAMSEIMDSSNKINDIISVIDEIAFQTNLLALNAAVEAARAGEQGRGFAVVAGEVRTLSQRSAAAAKQIKDLIRDSVNKVKSGSSLVNKSGQMLSEIVAAVDKVALMISDVNTAAIEQNSGIRQINQAISQMDEMTQQNAALVEETSAASRSMSEEAKSMSKHISFFRLTREHELSNTQTDSAREIPKNYQATSTKTPNTLNTLNTLNTPKNDINKGVASFSDDDWEDF